MISFELSKEIEKDGFFFILLQAWDKENHKSFIADG